MSLVATVPKPSHQLDTFPFIFCPTRHFPETDLYSSLFQGWRGSPWTSHLQPASSLSYSSQHSHTFSLSLTVLHAIPTTPQSEPQFLLFFFKLQPCNVHKSLWTVVITQNVSLCLSSLLLIWKNLLERKHLHPSKKPTLPVSLIMLDNRLTLQCFHAKLHLAALVGTDSQSSRFVYRANIKIWCLHKTPLKLHSRG